MQQPPRIARNGIRTGAAEKPNRIPNESGTRKNLLSQCNRRRHILLNAAAETRIEELRQHTHVHPPLALPLRNARARADEYTHTQTQTQPLAPPQTIRKTQRKQSARRPRGGKSVSAPNLTAAHGESARLRASEDARRPGETDSWCKEAPEDTDTRIDGHAQGDDDELELMVVCWWLDAGMNPAVIAVGCTPTKITVWSTQGQIWKLGNNRFRLNPQTTAI